MNVSKRALYGTAAVILLLAWANDATSGIRASLGIGVIYFASLRFSPRSRHTGFRGCGGTGEIHGWLFRHAHRRCPRCQGGRIVRLGAGHFGADHIQREYVRGREARKAARDNHVWR